MIVNDAYIPFFESKKRYAVLLGGAGSGKSIATAQKLVSRILTEKSHRILCIRKVATTLRNSIYQNLQDLIIDLGIASEFTINKSEMRFTHISGNEFILAGMDDPEKIKSIAGITSVWCEEATELDEADFNQLELRVRGDTSNYKQFILTFNPIDENHWLKSRFFDVADDDVYTIKTTFKDNYFLDEPYKKHLLERVRINPNLYKIYVLGEWGRVSTGGEVLKCFNYNMHVKKVEYDPTLALHLSFDENVVPYFPCGIFQLKGKEIRMIDCIPARYPNNKVKWMCNEIKRKFPSHTAGMFIYGDATSQKDDVKQLEGHDLFRLIIDELKDYKPSRRVGKSNPSVVMSLNFFNTILELNFEGISMVIDERCKQAIIDFENTKEASDGGIDKKTIRDKETGQSYQPFGHFCFIGETKIQTIKGEKRIDSITTDDYVLTRNGYKKVLAVHNNGYKQVKTYFVGNNKITCTPNHLFFTYNKGFKKIKSLLMCNDIFCIFDPNKNKICKQKLLVTEVQDLYVTPKEKVELKEFIIQDGQKSKELIKKSDYTFINICVKLAKYLKDSIYTIRTAILSITRLTITNCYHINNILANTLSKDLLIIPNGQKIFMQKELNQQKNGISQSMGENGTANTKKCFGTTKNLSKRFANIAKRNTKLEVLEYQSFATQIVKHQQDEREEEVFDLTIEDCPEYFANGILVHNCDLTRYLLTYAFASEYELYQRGSKSFSNVQMGKRVSKHGW